jgi:hypothetical protein
VSAWVKTRLRRDLFPAVCKGWAPDPRARAGWVLFDEARRQQTTGADYRKTVAARRNAAGKYVDLFGEADGAGVAVGRQKRGSEGSMNGRIAGLGRDSNE